MTQITSENIANNTITTSQIATTAVASLQGPRITTITITDGSYSALDDSAVNTSGGYIKITGANFATGCSVVIGTTSATTVTFTSSTELRVVVPALTAGSYTVYVTNTDGGLAIKVNGLTYSSFPAWSTSSTLSAGYETTNVNVSLSATSDSSITYTVNAGSTLPSGLSLSSGGLLSGTLPAVASDTNYSFVIQATDAELQNTPRTFSLNDQADVINWVTPVANGTVYSGYTGASFSQSLVANSLAGYSATITANSLPTGLSISGNVITGTPTVVANTMTLLTANANTTFKTAIRLIYINIVVASDPYFNLTTMATHASVNASLANGTVISDASTNNFELTVAGTPRATNFTPFGTGWSMYFNGSTDYLSIANSNVMNFSSSTDYTVEAWIYPTAAFPSGYSQVIAGQGFALTLGFYNGQLYITNNSAGFAHGGTPATNVWHHIAYVNIANTSSNLYLNGVRTGTDAAYTLSGTTTYIGANYDGSQKFTGYISNVRFVVGTAVYTGASYTVPTAPLTAITNTTALVCASNRIIDKGPGNYSVTVNGTPSVQSFNPFNLTNTGSDGVMYFPGSSYLTVPYTTTNFDWWTSDYTLEAWIYPTTFSGWSNSYGQPVMITNGSPTGDYNYWSFGINTSGYVTFFYYNGSNAYNNITSLLTNLTQWNHIAFTKSSSGVYVFCNGTRSSLITITGTPLSNNSYALVIGSEFNGSITGYVSNIRILKGTALYSGTTYTVPTSALTAITNTTLLILQSKYSHNTTQGHQDSSTNQLLITSAGSPAAGNFSPFSQSGWSTYFNGSTDAIITNQTSTNNVSGTTWTLECWFFQLSVSNAAHQLIGTAEGVGNWYVAFFLGIDTSKHLTINSGASASTSSETYNYGQWNHVAAVRDGSGIIKVYLNGVVTSATLSVDVPNLSYSWLIGETTNQPGGGGYYAWFPGYMSNVRICKGVAVYTGNFTVPTVALAATQSSGTNINAITGSQCILLTLQNNRFIDNSPQGLTISTRGTPQITAFNQFAPPAEYSQGTVGGSIYLNGSSDYLTTSLTTNLQFAADFTVECWIYLISKATSYPTIFCNFTNFDGGGGTFFLIAGHASYSTTLYQVGFNGVGNAIQSTTTIKYNIWQHVAVVRSGSTVTFYLNGVSEGTYTSSAAINGNGGSWWIGTAGNVPTSGGQLNGYISNFRVVKSTAVYTSTFTPPTSPVTSVANTTVLINGTSTALTDVSSRNNLVTTSLAKISSAQSKYGTASMYFGSGNYITIPSSNLHAFGTGDFTIEVWIYLTSVPTDTCIIDGRDGTGSAVKPCIFVQQSSQNYMYYVSGGVRIQGGTYSLNTWQHVAVSRSGTSTKMFVAGTQVGSTYTDSNNYLVCAIRLGYFNDGSTTVSFNGYMDDLRITRYARYTTNFTPMTETFNDK